MCQRLLNSSAVSLSHKEFCGCAAMPAVIFFIIPKLTVLWHFLKTKPFPTSSTVNFSPSYQITVPTSTSRPLAGVTLVEVAMALCCPGAAPRLPGWHGRQSECVSEGGQLAAGRTTPTLGFFLPSQLSRAVIAGLSSDEWLLSPPPTATGWRHGQCESRCKGMCQLGLQWLIAGFAQTERPHTHAHTHAVNLTVLQRHSTVPPRFS